MQRLMNIDRRIIFVLVFLGVAIPLLVDFYLPIKPTSTVQAVYDEIERVAAIDDGTVLLSFSYGASTEPEMQPMARSLVRHCFSRDIKVVAICLWPEAPGLAQEVLQTTAAEFGKTYGVDYAFMGYKPGNYSVILNMGQDFHDAFPSDAWGARSNTVPLTRNIRSLRDFDFVFDLAAGDSIEFWWIPFGQEKFGFPFAGGCTAVMAPDLFPFLQSRQLLGLIGGLAGAAEYEILMNRRDSATEAMRAQSVTHLIIIAFILFGNAVFFISRRRGNHP
jgi:hypothetical protein